MAIAVKFFTGAAMRPHLPALARLRVTVFREYPYLYDGTEAGEQAHLAHFAASPLAGMAVAFDDAGEAVGCSTCLPLPDAGAAMLAPFLATGLLPERYFYFGESVLLKRHRRGGVGGEFFAHREAHARAVSAADFATFCAVERPTAHPLRPPDHVPLDGFWQRRGYVHHPELVSTVRWRQVDGPDPVEQRLSFWIKPLRTTP